MLGLTVLAAREPVEERDDARQNNNAAEHHKCRRHRSSPVSNSVNVMRIAQAAMPAAATASENVSLPNACPNTSPATARFAKSENFSARISRRGFVKRSIVSLHLQTRRCDDGGSKRTRPTETRSFLVSPVGRVLLDPAFHSRGGAWTV